MGKKSDSGSGMEKSRIRDKHTGSATLAATYLCAGEGGAEDDEDDGQLGGSQSQPAPDLESEMEAGRIVPKPLPVSTPEPPGVRYLNHFLFLTFFFGGAGIWIWKFWEGYNVWFGGSVAELKLFLRFRFRLLTSFIKFIVKCERKIFFIWRQLNTQIYTVSENFCDSILSRFRFRNRN
jgi:hypothetical protein